MGSPEKRIRKSPLRLAVLLLIAGVGYEVVLTRHWIARVPLLPTHVVDLSPDQQPLGFIRPETFLVARTPGLDPQVAVRPGHRTRMEFLSFRAGETTQVRLSEPGVRLTTLPMQSPDESFYDFGNLETVQLELYESGDIGTTRIKRYDSFRPTWHPTPDAAQRTLSCYCVDESTLLYLSRESLYCCDPESDRLKWRFSNVVGLVHVENDLAIVMRRVDDPAVTGGLRPALIRLHSGTLIDDFGPSESFDICDISPDATLISFRTATSLEVWSLDSRERLWRKSSAELGVRDLFFADDGQSLEHWILNDFGKLLRTRVRIADGEVEVAERRRDPHSAAVSTMGERIGSGYAFFHDATAKPYEDRQVHELISRYLRLPFAPPAYRKTQLITEITRGRHVGVIDTSQAVIYTTPDGLGFALSRRSPLPPGHQLEFYAMPPRRDWLWMLPRAAGPPAAILLGIAAPRLLRRRRRRADLLAQQPAG